MANAFDSRLRGDVIIIITPGLQTEFLSFFAQLLSFTTYVDRQAQLSSLPALGIEHRSRWNNPIDASG